jgi:hypothetical protein
MLIIMMSSDSCLRRLYILIKQTPLKAIWNYMSDVLIAGFFLSFRRPYLHPHSLMIYFRFLYKDQDPASFSWEAQQIMKQAVLMRYSIAPFWYTLFFQANTTSKTVVQPLFFEYWPSFISLFIEFNLFHLDIPMIPIHITLINSS